MTVKKVQKQKAQKLKEYRPPVVALLGHVDHGKTSILDAICKTSVTAQEIGGITQGISVYSVEYKGRDITFVDTPGHEAFDLMRIRGGSVADIVLLIVAANDSVMPQTKESIKVIQKAKKPCIVVINKVDLPGIDIPKVKRELSAEGLIVESLGGDVPAVEVSAKENKGIEELLEMIQLVADVSGVTVRTPRKNVLGEAMILESSKDKSRGNIASLVVTAGNFMSGKYIGYYSPSDRKVIVQKAKGFVGGGGKPLDMVKEGYGAEIIGLSGITSLSSTMYCFDDPKMGIEKIIEEDQKRPEVVTSGKTAEEGGSPEGEVAGENLLSMMLSVREEEEQDRDSLRVIIKAGTQGSLDAITETLKGLVKDGLVEISGSGVGDITAGDIEQAINVKAIVLGFRVQINPSASEMASRNKILAKVYQVIYELTDEIEDAAAALQLPDEVEEVIGTGKVKKLFTLSDGTRVVGTRVESGELKQGARCHIKRGDVLVVDAKIISMRCGKETVRETMKGGECGMIFDTKEEIEESDIVECYRVVKS